MARTATLPMIADPGAFAFFLDFDGTLVEIVDDPKAVSIEPATLDALGRLRLANGGAVAIVSGRSIAQLDRVLQPLKLPAAGVHGLERRNGLGRTVRAGLDEAALRRLSDAVHAFADPHQGLLVETKPGSVALHYRMAPGLEAECLALADAQAATDDRIRLLRGKMVVEMMLGTRSKGMAIADFLAEEPFRGRRPFFAGDDVTDETGFAEVEARGGVGVKIGKGPTAAGHRMDSVGSFGRWLVRLADSLDNASGR